MVNEMAPHLRMSATERQHQLLEVALSAFSRRGFKGTTTKEIAADAGVTEAIIFQHFPSKEALYSAVLELHLDTVEEERWMREIDGFMERKDDEGLFRSLVLQTIRSYRKDPALARVILFAALEGHEQGLVRLRKQFAPILDKLLNYIARRQREGALVGCDPHAIFIGFSGIAHQYGLITQIMRAPGPEASDEKMAQIFTEILLHGAYAASFKKSRAGKKKKPATPRNRKAKK